MHKKARGNLSLSPTKSDLDHDVIERIRQIEATAISRGGLPDPSIDDVAFAFKNIESVEWDELESR